MQHAHFVVLLCESTFTKYVAICSIWLAHKYITYLNRIMCHKHYACEMHCIVSPYKCQGVSTGKYHAAILTNNQQMEESCMTAGLTCGDLVFPLVYSPELHFSEYNSVVADMKNAVKVSLTNLFVTVANF